MCTTQYVSFPRRQAGHANHQHGHLYKTHSGRHTQHPRIFTFGLRPSVNDQHQATIKNQKTYVHQRASKMHVNFVILSMKWCRNWRRPLRSVRQPTTKLNLDKFPTAPTDMSSRDLEYSGGEPPDSMAADEFSCTFQSSVISAGNQSILLQVDIVGRTGYAQERVKTGGEKLT